MKQNFPFYLSQNSSFGNFPYLNKCQLYPASCSEQSPRNHFKLSSSSHIPIHQQILWALPSKYNPLPTPSYHLCCYYHRPEPPSPLAWITALLIGPLIFTLTSYSLFLIQQLEDAFKTSHFYGQNSLVHPPFNSQ